MKHNKRIIDIGMIIAVLNIFDGFATNYGLSYQYIEEANPIMRLLAEISPLLFLGVKITLSILIFLISYLIYEKGKTTFQKFFSISLIGVLMIYIGITFMHIFWLYHVDFIF